MATTQETTITDLELAEEVLGDMVLAVDTSTDTKSISLKQLKTYLGSNLPTGFILPAVGRTDDARFTLLDGKTLAKSGTYAEFCAKVEAQVSAGNWFSCTEDEFNADVSKYGQCGRFVITSEYVRIPKITRFLGATVTLSEIGKTYAETLPNISGKISGDSTNSDIMDRSSSNLSGCFWSVDASLNAGQNTSTKSNFLKELNFDASRSSSAYQDGAKVQPDHTKYPYYMVVSTEGQSAPISVDINKVYEDLELKANKDLTNVSPAQSFKDLSIGWIVPDYTAGVDITAYNSPSSQFTCPKAGIINMCVSGTNLNAAKMYLNNTLINQFGWNDSVSITGNAMLLFVDKGDKFYAIGGNNAIGTNKFYPLKGA